MFTYTYKRQTVKKRLRGIELSSTFNYFSINVYQHYDVYHVYQYLPTEMMSFFYFNKFPTHLSINYNNNEKLHTTT